MLFRSHFPFDVQLNSSRRIGFNYSDSQNSILSHDGSGNIETLGLRGNTILFYSDYDASNPDGVERMRIDSSGNVLVGTTTSTGALFDVKNTVNSARTVMTLDNTAATATNQYGLFIRLTGDPNNATNYFLSCTGSTATRARIDSDGGIQNYQSNDNKIGRAHV